MLSHTLLRRLSRTTATTAIRSFSAAAPSVKDLLVNLTVVDPSGARKKITGMIGKTLYEIFEMQGIDIGPASGGAKPETPRTDTWMEPTFGEGPTSGYDHVVLAGKGAQDTIRVNYAETQQLEDHWDWDEIFDGSRLASVITVTKAMDGMTIFVPDRIVDNCP